MALVKCIDCGREVSDLAPACLGCGRPATANDAIISDISIPSTLTRPAVKSHSVAWVGPIGIFGFATGASALGLGAAVLGRKLDLAVNDSAATTMIVAGAITAAVGALAWVVGGSGPADRAASSHDRPSFFERKTWIICPNPQCLYRGQGRQTARGSTILLIFLPMLCVLPGILYLMFFSGYTLSCLKCGIKIRDI